MKGAAILCGFVLLGLVGSAWAATVTVIVQGDPATGPWGVEGRVDDTRDVMADIYLDGAFHHTESRAPYGFPSDNGTTVDRAVFGRGPHTVLFVFKLQNTTTEIGRASVDVVEGMPAAPPGQVIGLTFTLETVPVLTWDANTDVDLAGYKIYVGMASQQYGAPSGMTANTTATVHGLQRGQRYYFTVTAYDRSGNESSKSNEVSYLVP